MENNIIIIPEYLSNERIDIVLSKLTDFSRSMIQKLIYQKHISLNGHYIEKSNKIVKSEEKYIITPPKNTLIEIVPEKYDLDILYEDQYLIIVNKPAELIVHPGAGNHNNTLINKLAYHCQLSTFAGIEKLGTVHRLDKGVSGCIIFAKDNKTHIFLQKQFADRNVKKQYIAICHGILHPIEQYLENYIQRDKMHRQKMQIHSFNGKIAKMNIKLLKTWNNLSTIECNPITGRTHQIRVQLSNIKLPILGDKLYGKKNESDKVKDLFQKRIALHAYKIEFIHPNDSKISITSNLPKEFLEI